MNTNSSILLSSQTYSSYINFLRTSNCDGCDALACLIRDFDLDLRGASNTEDFRALVDEFVSLVLNR